MKNKIAEWGQKILLTIYAVLVIGAILWGTFVLVRNLIRELSK